MTARPIPGTQAQKVIFVALAPQEPPATTLTLELGVALDALLPGSEADDDGDELLHAASSDTADTPARTGNICRNRVLICAELL
ncbi:MAG TPA: hypothetical protein VFB06_07515 [Streptosporangiaceae bacterium]|nr:hypothetical protein [Streptosporangiaceae bacterium]